MPNYGYYLPLSDKLFDSVRFISIEPKTEGIGSDAPQKTDRDGTPLWVITALVKYQVRHILTVGASMTLGAEKPRENFDRAVIELGISSAIVVALVFAIFLSKATEATTAKAITRASGPLKKK